MNQTSLASGLVGGIIGGIVGAIITTGFLAPSKKLVSITTAKASPAGGHYSQAVVANGFVTISGLLPITSSGEKLSGKSFEEQVMCVLGNLSHILEASGSSTNQLVSCRVYVSNIEHWGEFNKLYSSFLGNHKPARCVVPVPVLHYGTLLELEAVATV